MQAKNGLGYLYFYGHEDVISRNQTKAFEYFLSAAVTHQDADSIYNVAQCYMHGFGTEINLLQAYEYLRIGASKFGHFDCITQVGYMLYDGDVRGLPRQPIDASKYLLEASSLGPWAVWVRRGFDNYLMSTYTKSFMCYLLASEIGAYDTAYNNMAYIIRRRKSHVSFPHYRLTVTDSTADGSMSVGSHSMSKGVSDDDYGLINIRTLMTSLGNRDSLVQLGHAYFKGHGVSKDVAVALYYYKKASMDHGHPLASAYAGVMYNFGIGCDRNIIRANRYYDLSLTAIDSSNTYSEIRYLVTTLRWSSKYSSSYISYGVEYVVKSLWK